MSYAIRVGLAVYAVLLRSMPRRYQWEFGAESLADLREILVEAERFEGDSVVGTTLKACLDLAVSWPGTWWAELRPEPALGGHGARNERPEMGERGMNVLRELRLAARTLAKRPGFTAVAVITLALGIGANVAIFSIVNAVLLRPLPYEDSDEIVQLRHHAPGLDLPELENSEGLIAMYRDQASFLEGLSAFGEGSANLTGGDQAARVRVAQVEPVLFDLLRVRPLLGRPFNDDDVVKTTDHRQASSTAILTYETWKTRFGADRNVLGRLIQIDGESVEVIGVMPEGFAFPDEDIDLYRAIYVNPDGPFGAFGTSVVARLAPGVSVEAAQTRATELIQRLPDRFPSLTPEFLESAGFAVSVVSLRDRMVANVESTLWIILGTVAFVLLIACANVANLFLVRAESRQKEMAVRAAMGAGRKSVAATFLGESLLLGLGGGIVGVVIASFGLRSLLAMTDLPRANEISLDAASLGLAALLSVVAGLVFGAMPMARYAGGRFAAILRDGSRGSTSGRERHRARNALVAGQLALALVLLVGSGLMLRSFAQLRAVDLGIEPEGVLTMALNRNRGEDPASAARFFQEAADRIEVLPGVETVGITTKLPLGSGNANGGSFFIESQPRQDDQLPPVALYLAVGPSYFRSMGIPIVAGRDLEQADVEEARRVVWVNEDFARTFLDGDAIGERITWENGTVDEGVDENTPWAEIVGVVGDVREFGLKDEDLRPNAYFPLVVDGPADIEIQSAFLSIKMAEGQDPMSLARPAEAVVREMAPGVPISATRTMKDIVAEEMQSTSVTMIVLAVATAMALFLGAIGLAGVISYVVGQRTREIGVRVALGAQAGDVGRMILRQSMVVTAVGTILGLIGAFGMTRLMEAILYQVSTTDPATFVVAPVVLVGVSLLATWLPVRRAARVDPIEALRAE